jgi:hypothetical protein
MTTGNPYILIKYKGGRRAGYQPLGRAPTPHIICTSFIGGQDGRDETMFSNFASAPALDYRGC